MKPIPFSPPDISEIEIKEVVKALKSEWITTGPRTKELERVVADYCNSKNCVCLNSQTAAAEMTLRLLGIGPGDEVIVPAYTYTASCSVICHVGATPIIIDSQKDCVEMDYDLIEKAITDRTKVIIPVDVGGCCCDYDRIFDLVERKKDLFKPKSNIQNAFGRIIVMADTAHSLGAFYKGRKAGSIADFSCFSFHAVKNMTTAEGGAVTWKTIDGISDADIYKQYQLLSLHGQSKDALAKTQLGAWEYDVVGPWYKCNMTDILASVGLGQMSRYDDMLSRRKEIVSMYNEGLSGLDITLLNHLKDNNNSSCHLYMVRLNSATLKQRNEFIKKMAEEGISCNVHYKPLPLLTAYKSIGFDIANYPNAFNLYQNEVTLPLHTLLTNDDVNRIISTFIAVYRECIKND